MLAGAAKNRIQALIAAAITASGIAIGAAGESLLAGLAARSFEAVSPRFCGGKFPLRWSSSIHSPQTGERPFCRDCILRLRRQPCANAAIGCLYPSIVGLSAIPLLSLSEAGRRPFADTAWRDRRTCETIAVTDTLPAFSLEKWTAACRQLKDRRSSSSRDSPHDCCLVRYKRCVLSRLRQLRSGHPASKSLTIPGCHCGWRTACHRCDASPA